MNVQTAEHIVRRIVSAHWDIFACDCWVCEAARAEGIHPTGPWMNTTDDNATKYPVPGYEGKR